MFGYCGNNPGNYIDDDGYLSRRNIRTLKNLFKRLVKSAFNYRLKNAYFQTEGMIHGQGTFAYANAKCGLGTYKDNGCGIIAVYNALQLLGRPRSLGSIEAAFQYRHGMIAWGMGGIGPWSMDTFFIANFIPYKGFSFYNDMLYHLKEGDVVVFTVMNNKYAISEGYHTMAAQYIQGRFEVYNRWSNGVEADTIDSLALVYENSLWIYGFIVGRPV